MTTGILPPELKSTEQLFTSDAVFSVPTHQRNFAWGPDEIEELWEDLLTAVARKSEYFLGTIVLRQTDAARFEIIDGQQRLTCLSMLFSAIRTQFLASSDDRADQIFLYFLGAKDFTPNALARPKLVLNRINNETFVKYVVGSEGSDAVAEALKTKPHESNRLLLEAYRFFLTQVASAAKIKGKDYDSFIVSLIDCLRSSTKFITIPVGSPEDAHLFFESLNARGKELAISDLVKNRLYLEAGGQLSRAEQLWEEMENQLGRRPIPEFLRHYWIAKRADHKALLREKHLYRAIVEQIKGNQSETVKLLTDLAKSAKDYAAISDHTLWPDDPAYGPEFERTVRELRLFRVTQCNPLLLNAIQMFAKPKEVARTFRIVANFSFRYFIIGNQSPGNLERESARIAQDIRDGSITKPGEVAVAFLGINPDKVFQANFSLASLPISRSRIARYLLAKLSNHMLALTAKAGAELIVDPDAKSTTLEHVLPQSFAANWKLAFPKEVDPRDYVDRIGNLTLLQKKPNSQAADKSFKDKRKLALDSSELPINKMLSKATSWSNLEIERRQTELAKIALQVWRLN